MARRKLKRRISWQLPKQENDTTSLGDDIENDSNCMLVDYDTTQADCDTYINPAQNNERTQTSEISTSNETLSNESMTNKSLSGINTILDLDSLNLEFFCFCFSFYVNPNKFC